MVLSSDSAPSLPSCELVITKAANTHTHTQHSRTARNFSVFPVCMSNEASQLDQVDLLVSSVFPKWRNQGTEMVSNLPSVSQPENGSGGI